MMAEQTNRTRRPVLIRILASKVMWVLVFAVLALGLVEGAMVGLSDTVTDKQAQFVADNIRRSAVQCYAIEGRFPSTQAGTAYLEYNYGLTIDHDRYVVYYESMGDNIIPQIQVFPLYDESPTSFILDTLGLSKKW